MCGMAVIIWSNGGFESKHVVWLLQFDQLLVLSPSICGMAVPIRSTGGFERKNVWYGCYNLVNLWFLAHVCVVWPFQLGQLMVLSASMCGMAAPIWSTCSLEHKYVWLGCYNLINLFF